MTELNPISRKLYIWVNQLLYIGTSPEPHREHLVVSDKLIVSLQGVINIVKDNGDEISTRTCLVKAGADFKKSTVNANNSVLAIYYLAPLTQDYPALRSIMSYARGGVHYGHPEEDLLIKTLLTIRDRSIKPDQSYDMLRKFIIQPYLAHCIFKEFDPRIVEVVHQIRTTVSENLSLQKFAQDVHLSESRLEKLFKDQVGVPITRYRLRYRVFMGIIHLATGQSITEAALASGFASSSHFSKSFSTINGVSPSAAFFKPPFLHVLIDDEILDELCLVQL